MKVQLKGKFLGVVERPGFRDPSKVSYIVAIAQGVDTLRVYVEAADFGRYIRIEPFSDVVAELDYNPTAEKVAYCMRLLDIKLGEEV